MNHGLKCKTVNIQEEKKRKKTGENLCNLGRGREEFPDLTKTQFTKEKLGPHQN